MSQHTPGPWAHRKSNIGFIVGTTADADDAVALVYTPSPWGLSLEEADAIAAANARLIAAAPEMYDALEKAASVMGWMLWDQSDRRDKNEAYAAVKAALEKAGY